MPQNPRPEFLKATIDQVPAMKVIADAHRSELGFVNRAKLIQAVEEDRIIVAILQEKVIGFVVFRHRKIDTQTTLSEICLDHSVRGQGYGRGLIDALYNDCITHRHTFIQLKCPVNLAANSFYEHLGFQKARTEVGKIRQLNVWELPVKEAR